MSVIERTGGYGKYYGSTLDSSGVLTDNQKETNARYIALRLFDYGWSKNAISALLGNMEAESGLNPGRWQSDSVGSTSNGYGLVQWTPATKYFEWCDQMANTDPSDMDNNLARILYEVQNNIQWIATDAYNYSFATFASATDKSVSELAKAFLLNYERPADQSESVQNYRSDLASYWYVFIENEGLGPYEPPESVKRRYYDSKYKFILFNKRRKEQWTRKSYSRKSTR